MCMQQVVEGVQMRQVLVEQQVVDFVLALGKLLEELVLQATQLLTVEQLGVEMFRDVNTQSLDLSGLQSALIVEDTRLSATVDLRLPLTANDHDSLIVDAVVPALKARLSLDELCGIGCWCSASRGSRGGAGGGSRSIRPSWSCAGRRASGWRATRPSRCMISACRPSCIWRRRSFV